MSLLVLVTGIGILLNGVTVYIIFKNRKQTKELMKGKKKTFQFLPFGFWDYGLYLLIMIVSGGLFFYFKDEQSKSITLFLCFMCLNSILNSFSAKTLYYEDEGFIYNGVYYRYKNIRSIRPGKTPLALEVQLKSNQTLKVSRKAAAFLAERMS